MMKTSKVKQGSVRLVLVAALGATALLAGCSSDDHVASPAPAPAPVPAPPPAPVPPPVVAGTDIPLTAVASSVASTEFVKGVVNAGPQDMAEGLVVGDAALATSESDEPDPSV
jgi:hypothetical protein